jgi:hypothetical protein
VHHRAYDRGELDPLRYDVTSALGVAPVGGGGEPNDLPNGRISAEGIPLTRDALGNRLRWKGTRA